MSQCNFGCNHNYQNFYRRLFLTNTIILWFPCVATHDSTIPQFFIRLCFVSLCQSLLVSFYCSMTTTVECGSSRRTTFSTQEQRQPANLSAICIIPPLSVCLSHQPSLTLCLLLLLSLSINVPTAMIAVLYVLYQVSAPFGFWAFAFFRDDDFLLALRRFFKSEYFQVQASASNEQVSLF